MTSSYVDLHNLSEITMDGITVSNLKCDSIITTDLTVSGNLTGLTTSSSSIFNYTYTPSSRLFTLGLANQIGSDYILITDGSGVFHVVLFSPLIYPLLSATSPILYNNATGVFSFDSSANLTFTGLITATNNTLSTISQANKVYVTPTSVNTNYFFPMFTSITAGYKDFVCESNTTFYYNPVTDQLTSSNFTGSVTIKTNSYQGLTTSSAITIGNALNTITMAGGITASTGLNIPTGQTYKINSVAINTDNVLSTGATNKYLNSLTATSPILYNSGTYVVSLDTTANIIFTGLITATSNVLSTVSQSNLINVTNTVSASNYSLLFNTASAGYKSVFSNANLYYHAFLQRLYTTNLTVSNNLTVSTTLNVLNFTSTGTFSVPDYSITNVMLEWSNIELNGQPMVLGGTYSIPALSITNGMLASNSVTLPKIDSSVYSTTNTASKLVQRDAFGTINVGSVKCNIVEYASSALVPCTINVSVVVPTTFPSVSTAQMGYYQNDYVSLSGATVTLGSVVLYGIELVG